ncbi:DUF2946 domain-containing protein [Massilia sp. YIM B02769]|uniref:DUF2946 domain-containing protein n=1 Tax=Massilia sp. YIM B02769 TaxID=3050129 RepID=UPI0025B62BC7|nr:DUF2946 domain-containing protein [Massilia sp. YIM B02769]MDN4059546.1 DUF2946 domain-containing protein [Massilia sp. YIM B02769]
MHRITRHWTAYAWIAALAILFNALAPVVSHAMSLASSRVAQVEVCTAMGIEMMPLASAPGADSPSSSSDAMLKGLMHCAYCTPHAGAFALLPPVPAMFAVLGGHDAYPPLFYRAPRPLFQWTFAQPRAPPALA